MLISTAVLLLTTTKQSTYVEPQYDFMLEYTQDIDSIDYQQSEEEYVLN